VPSVVVVTTTASVADWLRIRLPTSHETALVPLTDPWLGLVETSVTPAGSISVNRTPVA
jgi:hypothetical protein